MSFFPSGFVTLALISISCDNILLLKVLFDIWQTSSTARGESNRTGNTRSSLRLKKSISQEYLSLAKLHIVYGNSLMFLQEYFDNRPVQKWMNFVVIWEGLRGAHERSVKSDSHRQQEGQKQCACKWHRNTLQTLCAVFITWQFCRCGSPPTSGL